MSQLYVASRLVTDFESCLQQCTKNLLWFKNGKTGHSGRQGNAKLLFACISLIWNGLSVFEKTLKVAANRVAGHFKRFIFVASISDDARKQWDSNLIPARRRVFHTDAFLWSPSRPYWRDGEQQNRKVKYASLTRASVAIPDANSWHADYCNSNA
jgi:hypothetical protein